MKTQGYGRKKRKGILILTLVLCLAAAIPAAAFGLSGGLTAWRYSELYAADGGEGLQSVTLCLEGLPDMFTLSCTTPPSFFERYAEELDDILDSLRAGQPAHPQTAAPETAEG